MRIYLLLAIAAGVSFIGGSCGIKGVGDPCVPEDEYGTGIPGFAVGEVNVESRSFQCATRVCLVNHFQGRVSCPYGQEPETSPAPADGATETAEASVLPDCMGQKRDSLECQPGGKLHMESCQVPGRDGSRWEDRIVTAVDPQLVERQAKDTVYCSCRCANAEGKTDDGATYCECPATFQCKELVDDLGLDGGGQLTGSYCIKEGTAYDSSSATKECSSSKADCSDKYAIDVNGGTVGRNQRAGSCLPQGAVCGSDDTCCAPRAVDCVDLPANKANPNLDINCNATCVAKKCQHTDADGKQVNEQMYDVEHNACSKGDACP